MVEAPGRLPAAATRLARPALFMVVVLTGVTLLAEIVLQVAVPATARSSLEHNLLLAVLVAFLVNGMVLVRHRPDNAIGWLLVGIGGSGAWTAPLSTWSAHLASTGQPPDGWALTAMWVDGWYWPLLVAAVMFHLPALFPDGRLPSPRWRWVAWPVNLAVALLVVMGMTAPYLTGVDTTHPNLIGVAWMPAQEGSALGDGLWLMVLVGLVAGLSSLVVRYRRSLGAERQQLKWLLAAASLLLLLPLSELAADLFSVPELLGGLLFPLVVGCLPTAITVAVLRHRLYDIDRVVSRTVAYVLLAALLATVYLGGVLGLGAVARAVTGESGDLVVALSTLGVAAVFQPLRRRLQRVVDRRFNRARYDAVGVVELFGRGLREEVSLDATLHGLRRVAVETVHPSSTSVVLLRGATR